MPTLAAPSLPPAFVPFALALVIACACSASLAQGGPATPRFEIKRFDVEGATLVPRAEIDAALAQFVGLDRTLDDVRRAQEAVELLYVREGYGAVQVVVPEQRIADGTVRLQVIEARLRNVVVSGNRSFGEANIRRSVPALETGRAPSTRALARDLRLANESPVKQTVVVLRPTERADEVDADVRVTEQRPYRFSIGVDNTGTPETGDLRVGFGGQHANLFDRDHVLTLQYLTSPTQEDHPAKIALPPNDRVKIFGAGYHIPLYGLGDSIDLVAGYANVDSGVVQGLYNISGSGRVYAGRYNLGLPAWGDLEHKLAFGLDWRYYDNNVVPIGTTFGLVPDYVVHPASLGYSGVRRGASSELGVSGSVARNIPGGSNGDQEAFTTVRPGATANYWLARASANYTQSLPRDFQFRARAAGQYTSDLLVPGEQFGIGGMDSVRGLYEREFVGDKGFSVGVELYSPDFGGRLGLDGLRARFLVFYDTGRVYRNDPAVFETAALGVSSIGPGVRISYANSLTVRADWGFVQYNREAARQENRANFSLGWVF